MRPVRECSVCHNTRQIAGREMCGGCYARDYKATHPDWEPKRPTTRQRRNGALNTGRARTVALNARIPDPWDLP